MCSWTNSSGCVVAFTLAFVLDLVFALNNVWLRHMLVNQIYARYFSFDSRGIIDSIPINPLNNYRIYNYFFFVWLVWITNILVYYEIDKHPNYVKNKETARNIPKKRTLK